MILGAAFPNIFSIVRCKLSALVLRPSGPIRCLTWRSSIVFAVVIAKATALDEFGPMNRRSQRRGKGFAWYGTGTAGISTEHRQ